MNVYVGLFRLRTGLGVQTVTGITNRAGVAFTPAHLVFVHGGSLAETLTTAGSTAALTAGVGNTNTYHVADSAAGFAAIATGNFVTSKITSGGAGNGPDAGLCTLGARALGGGHIYQIAQVTGVALGSFDLTVTLEDLVVPTDVLVLALGPTDGDLQLDYLPAPTGGGLTFATGGPVAGLLNLKTTIPAPGGSVAPGAGGAGGRGFGWDSPQGGPASAHIFWQNQGPNYAYQSHVSHANTITTGVTPAASDGPHVVTWGPTSLTMSASAGGVRCYAVSGTGIQTASGTITQPASVGAQPLTVPFDVQAFFVLSVGQPASTGLQSPTAELCVGWTDGLRQGCYWTGESAAVAPCQGAVYLSGTSLVRASAAGAAGTSTTFPAVATLQTIDPQGTVTLNWTATDGVARELLWFAIGTPSPPPIPPAPPGPPEPIRRLRQAPHLWDGTRGHRLKYPGFQLLVEAGAPRDTDGPMSWVLQWSDDGGHSWSHEHRIEGSHLGEHTFRFWWRRLGQSRDRVFRVVNSDDAKIVIVDALLVPDPVEGSS